MQQFTQLVGLEQDVIGRILSMAFANNTFSISYGPNYEVYYEKLVLEFPLTFEEANDAINAVLTKGIAQEQADKLQETKESKFQFKYPIQKQLLLLLEANKDHPAIKDVWDFYNSL